MIEAIREIGHEVEIVSYHMLPKFFKCRFLSSFFPILSFFIKKPSYIIQVSDTALRYILLTLTALLLRIPMIQMVHHINELLNRSSYKSKIKIFCINTNFRIAKYIIVNSKNTRESVIGLSGKRIKNNTIIINPGVDVRRVEEKGRKFRNKRVWNILSVGAIMKRKGYHYLIDALNGLSEFSFYCTIVGNIDDREYCSFLQDKIRSYKLSNKIKITGYINDRELSRIYKDSDIFILPSLHEGYGIVLCEALCFALPIISTNVGAVSDILEDQRTGILVEPQDGKALRNAIKKILSDPVFAEELSRNAIEKCKCLQTWEQMQNSVKKLFMLKII